MKLSLPPNKKKNGALLSFAPPVQSRVMYFFAGFKKISPDFGPNSGFWCCVSWLYGTLYWLKNKWLTNEKGVESDLCHKNPNDTISPPPFFDTSKKRTCIGNNPFYSWSRKMIIHWRKRIPSKNWILVLNKRIFLMTSITPWSKSCSILHCINASLLSLLSFFLEHLPHVIPNKTRLRVSWWKVCRKLF